MLRVVEQTEFSKEFLDFLKKYGDVKCEFYRFSAEGKRYLGCELRLPDYNKGSPISLVVVYRKDGSPRRLDAWGKLESIPFP